MKFSKILFKNNITDPISGKPIINSTMKTISMVLENYFPGKKSNNIAIPIYPGIKSNNITDPISGKPIINSNMKTISMVLENYFPGKKSNIGR